MVKEETEITLKAQFASYKNLKKTNKGDNNEIFSY